MKDLKIELLNGENFANDLSGWYTVNRINKDGVLCICINGVYKTYKNINSYTKKVNQLLNKGY